MSDTTAARTAPAKGQGFSLIRLLLEDGRSLR